MTKTGDNLANVIQYLAEQHGDQLERIGRLGGLVSLPGPVLLVLPKAAGAPLAFRCSWCSIRLYCTFSPCIFSRVRD